MGGMQLAAGGREPVRTLLALEGVTKEFPGVKALQGVSFDLRAGEVPGIASEHLPKDRRS